MIAAWNEFIVKPLMIFATNQKNAPFTTSEKSPSVKILSGSVSMVMIGFTTILRNTKHAETTTAVRRLLTPIPETKCGSAKTASTVINHRSKIMTSVYYAKRLSTTFLTTAPSACPPISFITAPTSMPAFDLSVCPSSACFATAIARIFSSESCSGRKFSRI